jgi:CBS domain-containing protein
MRRSILTEKIARRGYHIYREYGIDPLERHFVEEVMTREVQTIDAETFIDDALSRYFGPQQTHRAFPVVRDEVLIGMIDRESLLAGKAARAAVKMSELFGANVPAIALASETCKTISTRLAVHALERLPVVDTARSRRLVGMVSRSDLVKPSLNTFDEEEKREVFRYTPLTAMNRRHGRG